MMKRQAVPENYDEAEYSTVRQGVLGQPFDSLGKEDTLTDGISEVQ